MMPFAVVATLIGAVLGLRFTVIAILPAMSFALTIAGATAITSGGAPTIVEMSLFLICLQVGYVVGAAVRSPLFAGVKRAWHLPHRPPRRARSS